MIGWLRAIFVRKPDVGLQLEAHRFGSTLTQPGRYDFDKAVAGKKRSEARAVKVQQAQVAKAKQARAPRRLRAVK